MDRGSNYCRSKVAAYERRAQETTDKDLRTFLYRMRDNWLIAARDFEKCETRPGRDLPPAPYRAAADDRIHHSKKTKRHSAVSDRSDSDSNEGCPIFTAMLRPRPSPPSMSARNFRLGQVVNYRPDVRGQNTRGNYQVIRFLPQRKNGEPEYQIRHLNEGHECVARESELRSV